MSKLTLISAINLLEEIHDDLETFDFDYSESEVADEELKETIQANITKMIDQYIKEHNI